MSRIERGTSARFRRPPADSGPTVEETLRLEATWDSMSPQPACFGRTSELRRLDVALQRSLDGHGSSWLLLGPSGIGKTRLLRRIAELGHHRGFEVRWSTSIPGIARPLFAIEQLVRLGGVERSDGLHPSGSPAPSDRDRPPRGRARTDPASSTQVGADLVGLIATLEAMARERPQLLLVDDVQDSAPESVRGLRVLVNRLAHRPALLVLAARTDSADWWASPPLSELRGSVTAGTLQLQPLGPLPEPANWELAASILRCSPREARRRPWLRRLIVDVGGNPYYLVEMLKGIADARRDGTGRLPLGAQRTGTRRSPVLRWAIPPMVRDSITGRFARMPAVVRRIVSVGARVGYEFDAEAVEAALRMPPGSARRAFRPYAEAGWPVVGPQGGGSRYSFDHFLTYSVLRAQLPPLQGPVRSLARWWEGHHPDDASTCSRLWFQAGERSRALRWAYSAALEAVDQGAFDAAVERWKELAPRRVGDRRYSSARLARTVDLARLLREHWEWPRVVQLLDGETERRPTTVDAWYARLLEVEAAATSDPGRHRRACRELEKWAQHPGARLPPGVQAEIDYCRVIGLWGVEDLRDCIRAWSTVRRRLEDGRHELAALHLLLLEGTAYTHTMEFDAAERIVRVARERLTSGRVRAAGLFGLISNLEVSIATTSGHPKRAFAAARRAIEVARRDADPVALLHVLAGSAGSFLTMRAVRESLAMAEEARRLASRLGYESPWLLASLTAGWCHLSLGEWEAAERAIAGLSLENAGLLTPAFGRMLSVARAVLQAAHGDPESALDQLPPPLADAGTDSAFAVESIAARSALLECQGKIDEARDELEAALGDPKLTASVWDRIELAVALEGWERRHGSEAGAEAARRRLAGPEFDNVRASIDAWRTLTPADRLPSNVGRPVLRRGPSRPPPSTASTAARILAALEQHPVVSSPAAGAVAGWSERELAAAVGRPRESIARALGRLLSRGQVTRFTGIPPGGRREVYLYRRVGPGWAHTREGPDDPADVLTDGRRFD
jgi:tetratricopeptide (TPR) repeat protein